ncbi:hypothetical protein KEJ37_07155 [Candidatus Bathyarchaeota archaeon]|nr:hypothetical protein [Candidatus Bathyarchaeota archaeon]
MVKLETYPDVYKNPYYYDVAFGFRDVAEEVNFFEEYIKNFQGLRLRGFLTLDAVQVPTCWSLLSAATLLLAWT